MSLPPLRPINARFTPPPAPSLRWLVSRLWWVEHAFERARADARPEEDTRVRIFVVFIVFSLLFAGLAVGATRAALFNGGSGGSAAGAAAALGRADVTDRNGQLLASNIVHYGLYIDPAEVWDRPAAMRQLRRALPRLSAERLRDVVMGDRRAYVIGGLTPQEKAALHNLALGGIYFEPEDRRIYPLGGSAAHLIGFSDSAGEGLAGVERAFNADIRAAGRAGEAFALSIDLRVQGVLENELRAAAIDQHARGAVGVVTDVRTGEVLAMASYPDFDPNQPGSSDPDAMRNRAAASVYEMGSTFKIFTLAAGIDAGVADLSTTFDAEQPLRLGGRAIRDFHAQNRIMTLEEVFLKSSNIGTSRLAMMMGPGVMRSYFEGLGLFETAPIELRESARPVLPPDFSDSTISSLSFGHAMMVSPLHMAAGVGAVMNGGRYVPLTVRRREPGARIETRQVISPATSAAMLDLMRRNVVAGSGSRADAPGLRVGGKTGSAEKVVDGRYSKTSVVSSFAAVFPTDGPVDGPRYLVLILLDEPRGSAQSLGQRTAGFTAAPVAGRVIDRIAAFLGVGRAADAYRTALGERIPEPEETSGGGR